MSAPQTTEALAPSTAQRFHYAIGPIVGAMILDATDLLTFGPLGIYTGIPVGLAVGFWLTSLYRFSMPARLFWSCVAGIYCTVPFTEVFPIATLISATHRFLHSKTE